MTTYSSNKFAEKYVTAREPFVGSNTWGEWIKDLYVVYSFGRHFPMYVWDDQIAMWFGNKDKFSRSTTNQQARLRPDTDRIEYMDTDNLKELVSTGSITAWTIQKAQR